jgi:hypothetical protein
MNVFDEPVKMPSNFLLPLQFERIKAMIALGDEPAFEPCY